MIVEMTVEIPARRPRAMLCQATNVMLLGERTGPPPRGAMRRMATALPAVALIAAPLATIAAQDRSPTDRSLGASLLAVSVPGPSAPLWTLRDSAPSATHARIEASYGRAFTGGHIGGVQPTVVLGLRGESQSRDSAGNYQRGATVVGMRVGVRAGERAEAQPISALELYFGARSMSFLDKPYLPDIGIDLVAGWGNLGVDTRASLGFRVPIEMIGESRYGRVTLFAAPSVAWGHIRVRSCEDRGPGDNCGDLGMQAVLGRTRFLLAGGASLSVLPARLSITAGVQRLYARDEESRVWIGTSWTP